MSLDAANVLRAFVIKGSGVTALVGTRVWTDRAVDDPTLPFLIVRKDGGSEEPNADVEYADIEVIAVADGVTAAGALDVAVRDYLKGASPDISVDKIWYVAQSEGGSGGVDPDWEQWSVCVSRYTVAVVG